MSTVIKYLSLRNFCSLIDKFQNFESLGKNVVCGNRPDLNSNVFRFFQVEFHIVPPPRNIKLLFFPLCQVSHFPIKKVRIDPIHITAPIKRAKQRLRSPTFTSFLSFLHPHSISSTFSPMNDFGVSARVRRDAGESAAFII